MGFRDILCDTCTQEPCGSVLIQGVLGGLPAVHRSVITLESKHCTNPSQSPFKVHRRKTCENIATSVFIVVVVDASSDIATTSML